MEKALMIGIVIAAILVVGIVLVAAELPSEPTVQQEEPLCGPETCDYNCGGNCSVPSCGCSR